jgi:L-amino acid N-acyltransferase YncA
MNLEFILLQETDLQVVKEIYDDYILNSTATFHTERVTIGELRETIPIAHPKYKSFLIQADGQTCGFCYTCAFKKRQAYDRSAEVTIYLKPDYFGRGIGTSTMKMTEQVARSNGIKVLIGIISGENQPSIRLFEKCGYKKCGHYHQVGEKFGRVLDVVSYEKIL